MHRLTFLATVLCVLPMQASPRDELLRAVPEDYTFCIVAQNLRGDAKSPGSSFQSFLAKSPLLKVLQMSADVQHLQSVLETILKELDVTPTQLFEDILGDAVVFVYRKGPANRVEAEDGLILLHARDEKLLAKLVNRINDAQLNGGELSALEKVASPQGEIVRRVKAVEGEPADYFALRGNRLVFSNNQSLVASCLKKLAAAGKTEPAVATRMNQLGVSSAPIAALVNPRSFDADLVELAKAAQGSEQVFLKEFAKYWQVVDSAAISFRYQPTIELALSLHIRKGSLPKVASKLFAEAGKRSPLWDRVPNDALFAAVGRIHLESLVGIIGTLLVDRDRGKVLDAIAEASRPFLESDNLAPLVRGIGPDIGFWLTAPSSASKTWMPDALLAVKFAASPEGKQAEEAAIKGLDFLARFACLSQKELRIRSEMQGSVKVQFLTSETLFPPGFQPSFTSKNGYVLVGSSPRVITQFTAPTGEASAADEIPIVRISVAAWRSYLRDHRTEIAKFLGNANGKAPADYEAQIESLKPILDNLDRVELVQRSAADRVTLALRFVEKPKQ